MPFAKDRRAVTIRFQNRRQCRLIVRQMLDAFDVLELLERKIFSARQPVRQMQPRRVFSSQDAGPRWRANRARGIGPIEPNSALRERVNVRCVVNGAAVVSHVHPTEIIDEEEDDVGFSLTRHSRNWFSGSEFTARESTRKYGDQSYQ